VVRKLKSGLPAKLAAAVIAMVLSAGLALAAGHAVAQSAAGTDAAIRPDFGALLQPPIRHWRPHGPVWEQGSGYGYGAGYGWQGGPVQQYRGVWGDPVWRQAHGYPPMGPVHTMTVDCSDTAYGATPLAFAMMAVEDGGTIYIRPSGRPCVESLQVYKSVSIIGEPASAFAPPGSDGPVAAIAPPPGLPCISIVRGVPKVDLNNLTFIAGQAGESPCIQGWRTNIGMIQTHIHYTGDAPAVYLQDGALVARKSQVDALSYDPAIVADDASVELTKVHITGASGGLDISLADGGALMIDHVDIMGASGSDPSASPDVGVMIHRSRGQPADAHIVNTKIAGFANGLWLQHGGGLVVVSNTMISHARVGVLSEGVDLRLTDSSIEARRTGIYVTSGHADISHNRIFGFTDQPVDFEAGAIIQVHENLIYPAGGCGRFADRYTRWCRGDRDLPEIFRDHSERRDEDHWGWEGGPFEPPPLPPPPPPRHWWQ
jgi:Right handed beta helix region